MLQFAAFSIPPNAGVWREAAMRWVAPGQCQGNGKDCFKADGQRHERWQARSNGAGRDSLLGWSLLLRWGIHGSLISRLPLIFNSSPGDRMVPVNGVVALRRDDPR